MSEIEDPPPEERFKDNSISLIEFVQEICIDIGENGVQITNEKHIEFLKCLINRFNEKELIEGFISSSYPYWDIILEKNKSFFIDGIDKIFSFLPINDTKIFYTIFSEDSKVNNLIGAEDTTTFWDYLQSIVTICIKYIHVQRLPSSIQEENRIINLYTQECFPYIKIVDEARKWDIFLTF
jgi:hypothetical protein